MGYPARDTNVIIIMTVSKKYESEELWYAGSVKNSENDESGV